MPHRKKIEVLVVRRTNKVNPADTNLIFGAPGPAHGGYPTNETFVTNDPRLAQRFADEMNGLWGPLEQYTVETRSVRV